jgi:hypothetical protein
MSSLPDTSQHGGALLSGSDVMITSEGKPISAPITFVCRFFHVDNTTGYDYSRHPRLFCGLEVSP